MVTNGSGTPVWDALFIAHLGRYSEHLPTYMFIYLTIFLFLLSSLTMLVLRLLRPRLNIQGFIAVFSAIAGLVLVLIARSDIPSLSIVFTWAPIYLFPVSPSLQIDEISWIFSLSLVTLAATIIITSIAQMGLSVRIENQAVEHNTQTVTQAEENSALPTRKQDEEKPASLMPNWLLWIAVLVTTSLGLVAVSSGNLLTLLLAWVALDIFELGIIIGNSLRNENRELATIIFSAKIASMLLLLIAGLVIGSQGNSMNFSVISSLATTLLVLAAAIRLGLLPPFITYPYQLHEWKAITTLLYLIPAAASYILLVRVASSGVPGAITPYILSLTMVVGIVSAIRWLTAPDEQKGKRYWMVGCASLAITSALLGQPGASLAWSIACLLSGGLVFSLIIRHRNLIPILILGLFNISALPFSAAWQTTFLYQSLPGFSRLMLLNILLIIGIVITQSALLAGFIRNILRGIIPAAEEKSIIIERWVWTLFPLGLLLVTIIQLVLGLANLPELSSLPIYAWIIGPFELLLSAMLIYLTYRWGSRQNLVQRLSFSPLWKRIFSNEGVYFLVWNIYRLISRVSTLISTVLEGDGGILWALVLFALIFVFLQR